MTIKTARYHFHQTNEEIHFYTKATLSRLQNNYYPFVLPKVQDASMTCRKQLDTQLYTQCILTRMLKISPLLGLSLRK